MDPLRCLRLFCTENKLSKVKLVDNNKRVLFGDEYEFPADVDTNFISINGRPYSLCSLLFYIQNCDLEPSKYYKLALQARIAQVYTANQSVRRYRLFEAFALKPQSIRSLDHDPASCCLTM